MLACYGCRCMLIGERVGQISVECRNHTIQSKLKTSNCWTLEKEGLSHPLSNFQAGLRNKDHDVGLSVDCPALRLVFLVHHAPTSYHSTVRPQISVAVVTDGISYSRHSRNA